MDCKLGHSVPVLIVAYFIIPLLAVPPDDIKNDLIMDNNSQLPQVNGTFPGFKMNYTDFSRSLTFLGGDNIREDEKSRSDKTYSQKSKLRSDSLNDNLDQNINKKKAIETEGSDGFNYDFLHAAPLDYEDLVRFRGNESNNTHDGVLGNHTNDEISTGHANSMSKGVLQAVSDVNYNGEQSSGYLGSEIQDKLCYHLIGIESFGITEEYCRMKGWLREKDLVKEITVDDQIDYFISLNRYFLTERKVMLTDFISNFSPNGLRLKINGKDGWILGADSLHRYGQTEFLKKDGAIFILFNVEFDNIQLGYDKIHVHPFLVDREVPVQCIAEIVQATVYAKLVKVESNDTCHLEVVEVRITAVNGFDCDVPDSFDTRATPLSLSFRFTEIMWFPFLRTIKNVLGTSLNVSALEFPVCHNIADTINLKY